MRPLQDLLRNTDESLLDLAASKTEILDLYCTRIRWQDSS